MTKDEKMTRIYKLITEANSILEDMRPAGDFVDNPTIDEILVWIAVHPIGQAIGCRLWIVSDKPLPLGVTQFKGELRIPR